MQIKEATVLRIRELCKAKGIAVNDLAVRAGVTPSTVYSALDPARKDIGIVTIKKICDGLEIGIMEFFRADIFRALEQELK